MNVLAIVGLLIVLIVLLHVALALRIRDHEPNVVEAEHVCWPRCSHPSHWVAPAVADERSSDEDYIPLETAISMTLDDLSR